MEHFPGSLEGKTWQKNTHFDGIYSSIQLFCFKTSHFDISEAQLWVCHFMIYYGISKISVLFERARYPLSNEPPTIENWNLAVKW